MKTTRPLVTLIALLGVWQGMFAENQAYAVLDTEGTLTFYYDGNKPASGAYDIPWDPTNNPEWNDYYMHITKVVFDNSFSNYHGLSSTANMFNKLERLRTIEGISNLNTENVTDMSNMFNGCYILNSLDLSNFNTSNVTNMSGMFQDCRLMTSFDLSNFNTSNVTDMSNMFNSCSISLTSLDLSNFNTSNVTNMSGMFSGCSALTEIIFSKEGTDYVFNTSNVTDMSAMFYGCSSLTSLDVSNFNTSSVTDMSQMFAECYSLTSLDVSNFNTSSVTNMSQMFYRCLALTEILFSKANTTYVFNTSNVTDMSRMFTFCSALTSLDVSKFNTPSVTDMSYMFAECNSLTSLDVSNFNTSSVTDMSAMFQNCISLKGILFSKENTDYVFKTETVINMSHMFARCIILENIDISHFTTSNVEDMSNMFEACKKLKNLDFSNFNTEKVTTMFNMFNGCTGLETIDIRNFTKTGNTSANQMFYGCDNLKEIICLNTWDDSNSNQMFNGCLKLKGGNGTTYSNGNYSGTYAHPDGGPSNPGYFTDAKPYAILSAGTLTFYYDLDMKTRTGTYFDFPTGNNAPAWTALEVANTITTVTFDESFSYYYGLTSTKSLFSGLSNPTTINNLNYLHTDCVTNMSHMFDDCIGLTSLDLSNFSTNNVSDMSYMFNGCSILESIVLTSFNTENVTDMSYMFSGCSKLTPIDLTNFNTSNVTDMSNMFNSCSISLTSLDLSNFNTSNVTNMSGMFSDCSALTEIIFSKEGTDYVFNTSRVTNMSNMFSGCSSLTSLDLSELNSPKVTDLSSMFYGCNSLTSLKLPNFDSEDYYYSSDFHLTNISYMFDGCSGLTNIDVSKINTAFVTDMSYMFNGCSNLSSIDLSEFHPYAVENLSYMFNGCSNLTSLYLNDFYIPNATNLSYMFNGCSLLENIYCKFDWTIYGKVTSETSVNMFAGCEKLPNFNSSQVTVAKANPYDGGYFSVPKMAYAYLNNHKLIFRYDDNWINLNSFVLDENQEGLPGEYVYGVTQVIFEPSFSVFRPTSTANWFAGMENLESITGLEYLNTVDVKYMNSMFYNCYNLTSLDLTSFDVSNVTDMGSMFMYCSGLEMIYAENWYDILYGKVYSSGMFADCWNLPNWDESNSNDIDFAKPSENGGYFSSRRVYAIVEDGNLSFHYDGKNTDKTTYDIDWTKEESWKDATFTTVTFDASFAAYKLSSTAGMFRGLTGLTTIYGLDNLNTSSITDMSNMFNGCTGLTTIYCGKDWSQLNVTSSDGMFADCTNLVGAIAYDNNKTDITYANPYDGYFSQLPQAYAVQEGSVLTFYYDNRIDTHSDAITYEIPWEEGGIEGGDEGSGGGYPGWIGHDEGGWAPARKSAKARTANEPITLVVFDPSFKNYHGLNSTANMFYFMSNLSSIVGLEYLNTENVTTMESMFEGCTSLTSLDLTSFNTEKVTTMESMFRECSSLTSLDLTSLNTEKVITLHAMFQECSSLTSLNLSNFNTGQAYQLWSMFQDCSSLTTLDLTSFDITNVSDVDYLFSGCSSLKTIFCNDDWSSKSYEYSSDIFWNCVSLKGSNGTTYDDSKNSISFARPDDKEHGNPGFFTPLSDDEIILYNTSSNTNIISKYAGKTKDVLLSGRTLSTSGVWNTLCLPFSLTAEQLAASPLAGYSELRTLDQDESSFDSSTGILNLNFTPATGNGAVTSIEAGKPYIIKWENGGENIVDPTFNGVTINNSLNPVVALGVTFMGTYDLQPFTSADDDILYIGNNNKLYYPSRDMTINAFRAWFQLTDGTASQIKAINLNFGDEENGIQEITTDSNLSNSSNTYFSLDGLRLLSQPATPGIYIHNGRKVMIK